MTREEMIEQLVSSRMESLADAGLDVVWTFVEEVLRNEYKELADELLKADYSVWVNGET